MEDPQVILAFLLTLEWMFSYPFFSLNLLRLVYLYLFAYVNK